MSLDSIRKRPANSGGACDQINSSAVTEPSNSRASSRYWWGTFSGVTLEDLKFSATRGELMVTRISAAVAGVVPRSGNSGKYSGERAGSGLAGNGLMKKGTTSPRALKTARSPKSSRTVPW